MNRRAKKTVCLDVGALREQHCDCIPFEMETHPEYGFGKYSD